MARPAPSSRRIEALDTLPLFWRLSGRRVVVTGGEPAAVWKAELFAAAGADVTIVAPDLCDEGVALLGRGGGNGFGVVRHCAEPWSERSFGGAAIIVGDAANEGEAWALRCAGRAAGVPVNVIDKPAWCDFQTATIVNRSPIVIGISTSGAAPIVGQAIRQRIEAVLGPALGAWAQLAMAIRGAVNDRLAMGGERRGFWQAFSARVFGPVPSEAERADLTALIETIAASPPRGRVTIMSEGTGRAEDMTLAGFAALQGAEIILHPPGLSAPILELARREAERVVLGGNGEAADEGAELRRWIGEAAENRSNLVVLLAGEASIDRRRTVDMLRAAAGEHGIEVDMLPALTDGGSSARTGMNGNG